ncbi:MAG TPA: Stf0 family sulfotransferase [Acetobacteraceae bacterium]|nr:Stf0 family sulfotransferase [Acetobacteraceae bacterium]
MNPVLDGIYGMFPESPHQKLVEKEYDPATLYDWDRYDNAKVDAFLLCFANRSGSTYLANHMASLGVFSERTLHNNFEYFTGPIILNFLRQNPDARFPEFMAHLIKNFTSQSGYFSAKLSIDIVVWLTRTGAMARCFRAPRFLTIIRRNIIAQAISHVIAMQTSQWTSLKRTKDATLTFNPDEIAASVRRIAVGRALSEVFFTFHGITPIEFVYEDIVADPTLIRTTLSGIVDPSRMNNVPPPLRLERQATGLNAEWEERFRQLFPKLVADVGSPA